MHYNEIKQGYFIARPNRFIAHIELDGQVEVCHVKNTGRCRELLTPRVWFTWSVIMTPGVRQNIR